MIIIHRMNNMPLPRLVVPTVKQRPGIMPAVVVTGPRQAGKTTLVERLTPGPRRYLSCLV
jgi:predicted AAA+ superfamily ATPase